MLSSPARHLLLSLQRSGEASTSRKVFLCLRISSVRLCLLALCRRPFLTVISHSVEVLRMIWAWQEKSLWDQSCRDEPNGPVSLPVWLPEHSANEWWEDKNFVMECENKLGWQEIKRKKNYRMSKLDRVGKIHVEHMARLWSSSCWGGRGGWRLLYLGVGVWGCVGGGQSDKHIIYTRCSVFNKTTKDLSKCHFFCFHCSITFDLFKKKKSSALLMCGFVKGQHITCCT